MLAKDYITSILSSNDDYPVDLSDVWACLGFTEEKEAQATLEELFDKRKHYCVRGNRIVLSIKTLSDLCLCSISETGRDNRKLILQVKKEGKLLD